MHKWFMLAGILISGIATILLLYRSLTCFAEHDLVEAVLSGMATLWMLFLMLKICSR